MTTFAKSLQSEIARVARRELKDEMLALRKAFATQRSEMAALKRQIRDLTGQVKRATKVTSALKPPVVEKAPPVDGHKLRFSSKGFAAHRAKLGITQVQIAQLLGASSLSVFKWETGRAQPRTAQLAKIALVRKLGKREAMVRLGLS